MMEHRQRGGSSIVPEDEPDDGDFDLGGVEDMIEELSLSDRDEMPQRGQLSGITRMIQNDPTPSSSIFASSAASNDDEMPQRGQLSGITRMIQNDPTPSSSIFASSAASNDGEMED
jgi:hypothetical protein